MAYRRNLRDYKRSQQPAFESSYKIWLEEELKKLEATIQSMIETYNPSYSGGFQSNVDQYQTTINTPKQMTFDTTNHSIGVYLGSPASRIYVDNPGYYNLEFSAQFAKSSSSAGYVWIWPRTNGVDVPDSATKFVVQGPVAEVVASWNFVIKLEAQDYVEIMWRTDDLGTYILHDTAITGVPEIPSVIATLTQISK